MLVFWKARLVVLAVPKTGTTALENALLPHADSVIRHPPTQRHCTVRRYRSQLKTFFEERGTRPLEVMAVMREPVSWLSSWHRYRARDEIDGATNSTAGISFDAFVDGWLQNRPPEFARVGRQSRFVSNRDGTLGVDYLFRYDRLEHAVRFLEGRLQTDLTLSHINASTAHGKDLSPQMVKRVRTEAPEEFTLWDALCDAQS